MWFYLFFLSPYLFFHPRFQVRKKMTDHPNRLTSKLPNLNPVYFSTVLPDVPFVEGKTVVVSLCMTLAVHHWQWHNPFLLGWASVADDAPWLFSSSPIPFLFRASAFAGMKGWTTAVPLIGCLAGGVRLRGVGVFGSRPWHRPRTRDRCCRGRSGDVTWSTLCRFR